MRKNSRILRILKKFSNYAESVTDSATVTMESLLVGVLSKKIVHILKKA